MFEKIKCKLTKEELEYLYYEKKLTQNELAPLLGVKSYITVRRMLHEYGIKTNKNAMRSDITKKGMSDKQFKSYLEDLYLNKKCSIRKISKIVGISQRTVRNYFQKYNIPFLGFNQSRS